MATLLSGRLLCAFLLALTAGRAAAADVAGDWKWTDARQLGVEGRGWSDTREFYQRLPARAQQRVRPAVWELATHAAGMCVRFTTDATTLRARWTLGDAWLYLPNMTAIGKSGLDLYVRTNGQWRWLAVGIPTGPTNDTVLGRDLIPGTREYLLYLPLHNPVKSLEIGIPATNSIRPAAPWNRSAPKPIVFYGTSITHGISASRPGLVHTAILQRELNWPVINLGFSGNGKMEIELADLLAELDPAVYVLDCLPNLVAAEIKERVEPFVTRLRAAHPQTPIVLVEDRTLQGAFLTQGQMEWYHLKDRAELKAAYERLKQAGVAELYYLPGENLLGADGEGTTDGSHPNDLGFMRQAAAFAPVLRPLLPAQP